MPLGLAPEAFQRPYIDNVKISPANTTTRRHISKVYDYTPAPRYKDGKRDRVDRAGNSLRGYTLSERQEPQYAGKNTHLRAEV